MISKEISRKCSGDISMIENYEQAISDSELWDCHHRLEIQEDGSEISPDELKQKGMYYHRPPNELIFLRRSEHNAIHGRVFKSGHEMKDGFRGMRHTDRTKKILSDKASKRNTGKKWFSDGVNNRFCKSCPVGFHRGRKVHWETHNNLSEDTKKRIGEATRKRIQGTHWYNNGTIEILSKECPEGFVAGRICK